MISHEHCDRINQAFPILQRADPLLMREFQQTTFFASFPAGKDLFVEGDPASALALVITGVVRVYKIGRMGREITLYRFGVGESCILTANAILSQQTFPALATVEQAVEAVMIPAGTLREWVRRHDVWRDFIFGLLSVRLVDMLTLVDEVVFRRMDARVASFLLERSEIQNPIRGTHQEIAAELGSSREVISRILEGFAAAGGIRSVRGLVEILNPEYLHSLAAM